MKIITPSLLHSSHFHKNFSRSLTFAPAQYGGLRFSHLFYILIQSKAKFFTHHYRAQDKTGKLLKISLDLSQLQCGMSSPFFSLDYHKWQPILTPTWFTHFWSLLSLCNISLSITHHWSYTPPRVNDQFLMDILYPVIPSTHVLYCINACRIYLQIITLSDLTSLDGTKLLPDILNSKQYRKSSIKWPTQVIPSHWWSTWALYLKTYIVPHLACHHLGQWTATTHQRWC